MRWDRLFADLESTAADAVADERDALAHDLRDEQWAGLRWRDLLGGASALQVEGLGTVAGRVVAAGDLVLLDAGGQWWAVVPEAVLAVVSTDGRAQPVPPLRRSRRQFLRALRDEAGEVRLARRDGSVVTGRVTAAGDDFVQVETAGRRVSVPWPAVSALTEA